MTTINKLSFLLGALVILASWACDPEVDNKPSLDAPPTPTFDILSGDTPNEFILVNTTAGAFITQWDFGDFGRKTGPETTITYPFMGTYDVKMTAFSQGGSASLTKQITVTQDDPDACFGNLELLTGCGEKVWILAPEANALNVGPSVDETWWGNSANEVFERDCHFNDRYIFRISGEYEYDNQGDFWADDDGSGNIYPPALGISVGCQPSSAWPPAFEAWDSGVHEFEVTFSELTINGLGAWMGLYKAANNSEATVPQTSITYGIEELTEDRLVISSFTGGGYWRFTFVPE
ncbi:MAG: PKD domain-containing protein [Bacteroidota bacterium]